MALQRLNIQAHVNAASHSEEFIAQAMATSGAINTTVHNLITHEVGCAMSRRMHCHTRRPGVAAAHLPTPRTTPCTAPGQHHHLQPALLSSSRSQPPRGACVLLHVPYFMQYIQHRCACSTAPASAPYMKRVPLSLPIGVAGDSPRWTVRCMHNSPPPPSILFMCILHMALCTKPFTQPWILPPRPQPLHSCKHTAARCSWHLRCLLSPSSGLLQTSHNPWVVLVRKAR